MGHSKGRPGRPRASGPSTSGLSPRGEILDAAANLFTNLGYAATTTRAIAEQAGLRQASLYYHFPGKDDLLAALLEDTTRPLLTLAERLTQHGERPEVRLWALCRSHGRFLAASRHNVGALYLLPELGAERFAEFRAQRDALKATYRSLVEAAASGHALAGDDLVMRTHLIFGLVESVILVRRENPALDTDALSRHSADAALRVAGCADGLLARVRSAATDLLSRLGVAA